MKIYLLVKPFFCFYFDESGRSISEAEPSLWDMTYCSLPPLPHGFTPPPPWRLQGDQVALQEDEENPIQLRFLSPTKPMCK